MAEAAMRDASWWNRPDTTSSKRYHVLADDGETPLCGTRMVVNDDTRMPARDVEPWMRCLANGCRQAFEREGEGGDG